MKKNGILNAELSRIVAAMGHTDRLVICDSGLPIPNGEDVVDLALATNIPRFLDTLRVVLEELEVERVVVADEMESRSGALLADVRKILEDVPLESVPHKRFKDQMCGDGNTWFVRTGEATPYANIILYAGVTF